MKLGLVTLKLLGEFETRSLRLDHANKRAQMPLGTFQTNDDVGMTGVLHGSILSPWIAWMQERCGG